MKAEEKARWNVVLCCSYDIRYMIYYTNSIIYVYIYMYVYIYISSYTCRIEHSVFFPNMYTADMMYIMSTMYNVYSIYNVCDVYDILLNVMIS